MDQQSECAGDAPGRSRAAVLLRRLGAAATSLALTYLTVPLRAIDDAGRFPMACAGAHQNLAWTPLCCPLPGSLAGAPRTARPGSDPAQREVRAVRRG